MIKKIFEKFRVSHQEVIQNCNELINIITKDLELFQTININKDVLDTFRLKLEFYKTLSSESISGIELRKTIRTKNNIQSKLIQTLEQTIDCITKIQDDSHTIFEQLKIKEIQSLQDKDLNDLVELIISKIIKNQERLQIKKFDFTLIDLLVELNKKMAEVIVFSEEQINKRDINLWLQTDVSESITDDYRKFCLLGQKLWKDKSTYRAFLYKKQYSILKHVKTEAYQKEDYISEKFIEIY